MILHGKNKFTFHSHSSDKKLRERYLAHNRCVDNYRDYMHLFFKCFVLQLTSRGILNEIYFLTIFKYLCT